VQKVHQLHLACRWGTLCTLSSGSDPHRSNEHNSALLAVKEVSNRDMVRNQTCDNEQHCTSQGIEQMVEV